jgi:hypothetical protein
MDYQIVIARYNEDINYFSFFKNIIIVYNKGEDNIDPSFKSIKLPNIGRESHTYLYHIIQNYDNLSKKILFIQGKIDDHKPLPTIEYFKSYDFIGRKSKHEIGLIKNHINHAGKYLKELKNGNLKKSKYTPYNWINMIGIDISELSEFEMIWGANFCVSKELIHKKPKIFYENLMKYIEYDSNPEEGHFFERSWYLIFNNEKFHLKKIILNYYIKSIDYKIINICNNILKNKNIKEIHLWMYTSEENGINIYKVDYLIYNLDKLEKNWILKRDLNKEKNNNNLKLDEINKNIEIPDSERTFSYNILADLPKKVIERSKRNRFPLNNLLSINNNIYLIKNNDHSIINTYYKDNFEEYYIKDLIEYYIENN